MAEVLLAVAPWLTASACIAWLGVCAAATLRAGRVPNFADQRVESLDAFPKLTVVIPACNEANTLEAAMHSLLQQDYPDLEVVLINDRSTDATPAMVDRLAAEDDRVIPVHIDELPADWLGKLNALRCGTELASGQWLLFADADVRFEPGALKETVAFAVANELDHVSLIPEVERRSFTQSILTDTFGVIFILAVRMDRVADPACDDFFGVGAFNLVRREAFERTEGFEWLRMEIADDMGLALLLRRHGARAWAGIAPRSLKLLWYASAAQMVRGLEKNLFAAAAHLSFVRAAFLLLGVAALLALPVVGLLLPAPLGWPMSLAVVAGLAALSRAMATQWGSNPAAVLLLPVGVAILFVAVVRSTWMYARTGGALWRGTHYPTDKLREYQRVKL